jgi:hypothetical protein
VKSSVFCTPASMDLTASTVQQMTVVGASGLQVSQKRDLQVIVSRLDGSLQRQAILFSASQIVQVVLLFDCYTPLSKAVFTKDSGKSGYGIFVC